MKRIEEITPGQFAWVMDDNLCLKMIQIEAFYYSYEEDLEGWNIVCNGEEYFLESCYELDIPMFQN